MSAARYAVYFAPAADDPLWHFGCSVLGYDAASGRDLASPPPDGVDAASWSALIAAPRRYGFHATLKAPFVPAAGIDEAQIVADLDTFASRHAAFSVPPLRVAMHHGYVVLVPEAPAQALQDFAAACVAELDHLRAPLSQADLARRLEADLTERQRGYLTRFGYPYVFEDFRFHMTLAGPRAPDAVRDALAARFAAEVPAGPLRVTQVALFAEPERGADFRLVHRSVLAGKPA